jgi:PGF-CTERM protein
VDKSWLQDKNIDQSSITLNRYSDGKWDSLSASLSGDDDKYLYFTAKTPGFSPFAITGKAKAAVTETQPEPNTVTTSANVEPTPVQTENKNTSGKGKTSMPGFEIVSAITGLLAVFLYRRR